MRACVRACVRAFVHGACVCFKIGFLVNVFCMTQRFADRLFRALRTDGIKVIMPKVPPILMFYVLVRYWSLLIAQSNAIDVRFSGL